MSMHQKAMLVTLNIRSWNARKTDRKVSKEIGEQLKMNDDYSRRSAYHKALLADTALKEINAIAAKARAIFLNTTLPWNTSTGIARIQDIDALKNNLRDLQAEYHEAARKLEENLPELKEAAKKALNGAFNEDDYPKNVLAKFRFHVRVFPIPDVADFRVDCNDDDAARMKAEIEESIEASVRTAVGAIYGKLTTVVGKLVDRLEKYDSNGKKSPFRDSLVENIEDMLHEASALNIFDDKELSKMLQRIFDQLCDVTPEELRESKEERDFVVKQARKILDDMSAFI